MAKVVSKEVWYDDRDRESGNELDALCKNLGYARVDADNRTDEKLFRPTLTPAVRAAIDALHEYAHRGDPKPLPVYRDYREAQARIAAMKPGDPFRFAYGDGTVAHDCVYAGVDVNPVDGETIVAYYFANDCVKPQLIYTVHESDLIRTLVREDV